MQAEVTWIDARSFRGVSGSGHTVVMDGPPESGGRNSGVRPMEMLLLGLGGCSSFDVVDILERGRTGLIRCKVDIDADRAEAIPAVFEKIHLHFRVAGARLTPARVQRAIDLALEKYCSATIMLERAGVQITHDFEIEEVGET